MEQSQDSLEWQDWPEVQYPDIYNNLVAIPGPYAMQELKAYKGIGNLWMVRLVFCFYCLMNSVLPAKAWMGTENKWYCDNCDCMAGLGEACSHIAAILFALDANMHARKSMSSCTSLPCSWLPSSSQDCFFCSNIQCCQNNFYNILSRH